MTAVMDRLIDDVVQQWMEDEQPGVDDLNCWLEEHGEDACCDNEFDDFIDWLHDEYIERHGGLTEEDYEPETFLELFADWRCSSAYEQRKHEDYESGVAVMQRVCFRTHAVWT